MRVYKQWIQVIIMLEILLIGKFIYLLFQEASKQNLKHPRQNMHIPDPSMIVS